MVSIRRFFRHVVDPQPRFYPLEPKHVESIRTAAETHRFNVQLVVDGSLTEWNPKHPPPDNAQIADQYAEPGKYALNCDGNCEISRKLMRWHVWNALRRDGITTKYTDRDLYINLTAPGYVCIWMRRHSQLWASLPKDMFNWFIKKYILAYTWTQPYKCTLPTHTEWLHAMAQCVNFMLISSGSAQLQYN